MEGETLVSVCDEELIGEEFREGEIKLEVSSSFYSGEEVSVEECIEAIKDATIANLVGSIVKHAIEAGIINSERVLEIQGTPHAQMARP